MINAQLEDHHELLYLKWDIRYLCCLSFPN